MGHQIGRGRLAQAVRAQARRGCQVHAHAVRERNFVQTVNPQQLFGQVRLAGYVPAVGGNFNRPFVGLHGRQHANVQGTENGCLYLVGHGVPHQLTCLFWGKHHTARSEHGGVCGNGLRHGGQAHVWARLANQVHETLQCDKAQGGVHSALVAEGGVGVQGVALGRFAHGTGGKPGRFHYNAFGGGLNAGSQSAKHPRQTQRVVGVGYD